MLYPNTIYYKLSLFHKSSNLRYNGTYFCKLTVNVFHLRNYFLGLVLVRVLYLVSVEYVA